MGEDILMSDVEDYLPDIGTNITYYGDGPIAFWGYNIGELALTDLDVITTYEGEAVYSTLEADGSIYDTELYPLFYAAYGSDTLDSVDAPEGSTMTYKYIVDLQE